MTYKSYNCNSFNVHTIKTDKFKTCHMEIIFQKNVEKEDLPKEALLVDVLSENNKMYPTRAQVMAHLEDLYKPTFYGLSSRLGGVITMHYILNFIAPKYINEDDYLENVLKFPFDMLQNPNVTNDEFDNKTFKICQKRLDLEIKSVNEDAARLSVCKTLESLPDSPSSYRVAGSSEDLLKLTPASLYEFYKNIYKTHRCDIFIIGDADMDKVVELIKKYFRNRVINKEKLEFFVKNPVSKKVLEISEQSHFNQTNLNLLFNLTNLTDNERNIVFNVYNYILGSGGLTSKLYQEIREKNSYCYQISSLYLKYDNLLLIHTSLDKKNCKNAIKLARKVIKQMALGKFSEDEIKKAITSYESALALACDSEITILNNYVFNIFLNLPLIEERKELLKQVTYEDIVRLAKKVKLNRIFTLEGTEQE